MSLNYLTNLFKHRKIKHIEVSHHVSEGMVLYQPGDGVLLCHPADYPKILALKEAQEGFDKDLADLLDET